MFFDITSVVNEPWCDDVSTLLHMQQLSQFKHFEDVEILGLNNCDAVDVLISNDNAHLIILTPFGWLACGGRFGRSDRSVKIFRTNLKEDVSITSSLKQTIGDKDKHITELESEIKDLAMKDELPQPSCSDLAARKLVEPHVKLNLRQYDKKLTNSNKLRLFFYLNSLLF